MQSWRVTKYDPARRDKRGAFIGDDWTSISDIGRSFGGVLLTREEYLRSEGLYVEAVLTFLREAGLRRLQVSKHEPRTGEPLLDGTWVEGESLEELCRRNLREET